MKDKITEQDKAFGRAVENAKPAHDAPDYHEMLEKTYRIAMERSAQEKTEKSIKFRRNIRRSFITVGAAILILLISTIVGVLSPPPSASADSWYDKIVITLRNAFRIETTPREIRDMPEDGLHDYTSIEAVRASGYAGYLPTYLPVNFSIEKITVSKSDSSVYANVKYVNDGFGAVLIYQKGTNIQTDITNNISNPETFEWNGFLGVITQDIEGSVVLACVNKETNEVFNVLGDISIDDAKALVESMTDESPEAH